MPDSKTGKREGKAQGSACREKATTVAEDSKKDRGEKGARSKKITRGLRGPPSKKELKEVSEIVPKTESGSLNCRH